MIRLRRSIALVALLGVASPGLRAEPKVDTQVVAPALSIQQGTRYFFTPRDGHLIALTGEGSRTVVIYDGQKGPPFDNILIQNGLKYDELTIAIKPIGDSDTQPVIFSEDGNHWAYAARAGSEIVVMRDAKEVARINNDERTFRGLFFAPGSDQLYWNLGSKNSTVGSNFAHNFVVQGVAGPTCAIEPNVRFSRDGKRHAYVAARMENRDKKFLVIDGKEAGYYGETPIFTGDGKQLITVTHAVEQGKTTLQVDGKPQFSAVSIAQIYAAPRGSHVGAIVAKPEARTTVLYLDGKEIAGTEGVTDVYFSPDGNRSAAKCATPNFTTYFVIDGKRTPEYAAGDAQFSPDSSKFFFVGGGGGKQFMVVNNTEGQGFMTIMKPIFSPDGKCMAYLAMAEPGKTVAVVDDTVLGRVREMLGLMFSPDSGHYALIANDPAQNISGLMIDGEPVKQAYGGGITPSTNMTNDSPRVTFSRDGKHTAYMGVPANNPQGRGLAIDGKFVPTAAPQVSRGVFSPDGNHFFWVTWKPPKYTVWLDGREVSGWEHNPTVSPSIEPVPGNWAMSDDGTLTFAAPEGTNIKRVRITPDDSTSLTTMFADVESAAAKALADADAAKSKAAADAKAAQEKAAADAAKAKADADAAAAKRAQDRADAAAAKAKAREDALEAKRKAREDAKRK